VSAGIVLLLWYALLRQLLPPLGYEGLDQFEAVLELSFAQRLKCPARKVPVDQLVERLIAEFARDRWRDDLEGLVLEWVNEVVLDDGVEVGEHRDAPPKILAQRVEIDALSLVDWL